MATQLELMRARATAARMRAEQEAAPAAPSPRKQYTWSEVPGAALSNVGESGTRFIKGAAEAITHPIQTGMSLWDAAAGGLRNTLPEGLVNFIDQLDADPQTTQRIAQTADAIGGVYKDRYGGWENIRRSLAEDPVGAVSDLSALVSGGATAVAKAPVVAAGVAQAARAPVIAGQIARAAPAAQAFAKPFQIGATVINPMTPITHAVAPFVQHGIGKTVDLVTLNRPQVKAGQVLRNALSEGGRSPENILAARQALLGAPSDITPRQALAPVVSPQVQRLGQVVVGETAPGAAMTLERAQEAARMNALRGATPDMATAQAMRGTASQPLYTAATNPATAVVTQPLVQNIDAILAANPGNTKLVTALNQVKNGLAASTNAEQVSSVLDNLKDLISSKDNKFIVKQLIGVKDDIIGAMPGYEKAQKVFAATSGPVNQAKVLGAMTDVLESPLGVGERSGPFMTAMGRGEQALLKKTTGQPRYTELNQVLTPSQMKVVTQVNSELLRDADIANQAAQGAQAMRTILEAGKSGIHLPNFLNAKVVVANEVLKILRGTVNQKVMNQLERAFNSNAGFLDVMNKIPAAERIDVLRVLGTQLSPVKLGMITQGSNALSGQPQQQNMLAQ